MAIKKLFASEIAYPSAKAFTAVPKGFTFQPENTTRFKRTKQVSLKDALDSAKKIGSELVQH